MTSFWIVVGYFLAVSAGVSFVMQQALNANLRADLGSPWLAGFVSYLGGTIVMLVPVLVLRQSWPSSTLIHTSHWLSWTGGLFGAIYIAVSIIMIPRLGTATVIALIVAGQMIGALIFDQYGLLGVPVHPVSALRLIGAAMLVGGAILVRL